MPVITRDKVAELKTCPHCENTNGLYLESDRFGSYLSCIQCGWMAEVDASDPEVGREERNRAIWRRARRTSRERAVELNTIS